MTDDDDRTEPTIVFGVVCDQSNFHPFECEPTACVHCNAVVNARHDPETCAMCMEDNG